MSKLGWDSLGTSFDCTCGLVHRLPIRVCHIGTNAAARLAAFARAECGSSCLVVSDENTHRAAGDKLLSALSRAGKTVREQVYGPEPLDATAELAEEVKRLGAEADFFVAIGAGTLSDLAKYAGDKLKRPVLLYPTAASMNGYTSGIVALKVRGLKRTLPCAPAIGVFADPQVVATAPQRMTAAGVGDFLSKCSSSSDWRAAHFLRGGYYCERPREFFEGVQDRLLSVVAHVGQGNVEAVGLVLEALLLSGLSMVVAGSSAPASGGEHLISHYLDMKHALYGTPNDLHGSQVGVGTVYCLGLWERVLAFELNEIEIKSLLDAQPSEEDIQSDIERDWGAVSEEVWQQWKEKSLTRDALREELGRFQRGLPELRAALHRDLLPSATVASAIEAAGGPSNPEGLNVPVLEYQNALRGARYLRNRFTILDLAAELGAA
ncbi:MAG: iron-containing alcohol dehydrogenase [Candidatus Hydrogenedentes bacterium]|nr:iron-containing alcohol dehydrogenase [Candidatus Hydrogenedentota bacterium]